MAAQEFADTGYPSLLVINRDGHIASRMIMSEEDNLAQVKARIAWARAH